MKQVREYTANGLAGCVMQRRNRNTGFLVGVYNNEQAGMDDDGGRAPWSTVCEEHGHVISHATLALARSHAADPEGWCEQCGSNETE
jgi:hypothetical protein